MKEVIDEPYSSNWLKSHLMQHYGDSVIIADCDGCQNVLHFKGNAKHLFYEFYRQGRLEQDDDEKARVIKLAVDLIRSDIKDLTDQTDTFFSFDNLNSSTMLSFVPETLQFVIHSLCPPRSKPKDVKIAAIGQAVINLARPNTILCPLLLAFAAEVHHKSGGSEFVVQLLHSMGFGSSIEKVHELEKSLCFRDSSPSIVDFNELLGLPLYSADNADILQATIDGKNTLHMIGIIRSVVKQGSM